MTYKTIAVLAFGCSLMLFPSVAEAQWQTSGSDIYYQNGKIGIGTKYPTSILQITSGNSGDAVLRIHSDQDNNNEADNSRIELRQDGGTLGADIGFNKDWEGSWQPANVFRIGVRYSGNDLSNAFTIKTNNGNVGIGTSNPDKDLTIDGIAKAKEIIVEENIGADFVFTEDYELPKLKEIESHIQKHRHLQGIPSAEEMKTNGVKVGDLQMKLLQKIEELTLYAIEMKKSNIDLKQEINKLTERVRELEKDRGE